VTADNIQIFPVECIKLIPRASLQKFAAIQGCPESYSCEAGASRCGVPVPGLGLKISDFETEFRLLLTGCVYNTARLDIRQGFVDQAVRD
jgi:hypothetical protein